jgi:hypothetical protein
VSYRSTDVSIFFMMSYLIKKYFPLHPLIQKPEHNILPNFYFSLSPSLGIIQVLTLMNLHLVFCYPFLFLMCSNRLRNCLHKPLASYGHTISSCSEHWCSFTAANSCTYRPYSILDTAPSALDARPSETAPVVPLATSAPRTDIGASSSATPTAPQCSYSQNSAQNNFAGL